MDVPRTPAMISEALILQYMPLVRVVANTIRSRIPRKVELDELICDGNLGLVQAIQRYDPNNGACVKTWVEWRIRGAILDGLRQRDPVGRYGREHGFTAVHVEYKEFMGLRDGGQQWRAFMGEIWGTSKRLLSPRDHRVMVRHFVEGELLEVIAKEERIHESRVSQILRNGTAKVRSRLTARQ